MSPNLLNNINFNDCTRSSQTACELINLQRRSLDSEAVMCDHDDEVGENFRLHQVKKLAAAALLRISAVTGERRSISSPGGQWSGVWDEERKSPRFREVRSESASAKLLNEGGYTHGYFSFVTSCSTVVVQ